MKKTVVYSIIVFFLVNLSILWGQSARPVGVEHRNIRFTVENKCILPDSLLRQKITIANHSLHNIWLSIDHLEGVLFSINNIQAIYTNAGAFSGRPGAGYLSGVYILLTRLKPNNDTTIVIDTDIPYNIFQTASLVINIDFLEDTSELYSYIQTYHVDGVFRTGIPYKEYEDRSVRYSLTLLP